MTVFLKRLHRWVGLLIGIQVLLWLLSGLMMSLLDPGKVSGERWARKSRQESQALKHGPYLDPGDLPAEPLVDALGLRLQVERGRAVYRIIREDGVTLIDATDGSVVVIDEQVARQLALEDFSGDGEIVSIESGLAPGRETRNSTGRYWRVDFSDRAHSSLYLSASTGHILERRNRYWRVFDFFWMLHIMDYAGREDFNNSLIIIVALIAIWLGLSGFALLFSSFSRRDFDLLRQLRPRDRVPITLKDPSVSTPLIVQLRKGNNLFLELAAQGISLPSNCGGGGCCGLCMVQLAASDRKPPLASETDSVPENLLDQGFRLACQHYVENRLTLNVAAGTMASETITAEVRETRFVTPFIKEIRLEADRALLFEAGSYFQVVIPAHEIPARPRDIPDVYQDEWADLRHLPTSGSSEPFRRAYSPANHPGELGGSLLLNVRFQPPPAGEERLPVGAGSAWMQALAVGASVQLTGPFGQFHALETDREMVFIGGGAGMAPLRSIMMDQLVTRASRRPISFWYGVRGPRELFYRETFDRLQRESENFRWVVAMSGDAPDDSWQGPRGFIHQVAFDQYLRDHPNIESCEFYLCGPPAMLEATLSMLAELGVQPESIRHDDFGS